MTQDQFIGSGYSFSIDQGEGTGATIEGNDFTMLVSEFTCIGISFRLGSHPGNGRSPDKLRRTLLRSNYHYSWSSYGPRKG